MIKKSVNDDRLIADLFHDGSGRPRKAIILLGGSEGGKVWSSIGTRSVVNELNRLGYTLLSLAYFNHTHLPSTCEEVPLEYFERAIVWLSKQPEVIPGEIAFLGVSKGAEAALLLGSLIPKVAAVIALSPSSVIFQGVPKMGIRAEPKSSWTYREKPFPFVPFGITTWNAGTLISTMLFGTLCKIHEKALLDKGQAEKAAIPVEKIHGAVLLASGKHDNMWPSTYMCEQIISRMDSKGFGYPHSHLVFDAGHNDYILRKPCLRSIITFLKNNYV